MKIESKKSVPLVSTKINSGDVTMEVFTQKMALYIKKKIEKNGNKIS